MHKVFVFKIVVIGDPAVGKTSLIYRFSEHKFEKEYKPTLGANILIKDLQLENNTIKFLIYDIAGHMNWDEIRQLYYKGAQAAIIVFDVTRPKTLSSVDIWNQE
ncbi:MAG: Rab family GTPase, partial [Candidatus Helarchaeota archaeon]